MEVIFSHTSSHGNCSVIKSKDGHLLIIDAGLKYKQVDKEIGYRLHKADALLITHEHKDHTKYVNQFIDFGIKVYMNHDLFNVFGYPFNHHIFMRNKMFATTGFSVIPIEMKHTNSDGSDCPCFGFFILDESTGEKMLWATDTEYIKNKFQPLEYYCIESNFFESNDYNEFNNDENDYFVKVVEQRRVQSHMSFESAVKFLKMQDLSKCKEIRLLHLSTSLSEEDKKKMKRKLRSEIASQIKGKEVKIFV